MKKYILTLLILVNPYSTMFASEIVILDQKADLQTIAPAQKATPETYTDYLDQLSFTAFHPHELDPTLAVDKADGTEPIKKSLHGRFDALPDEMQLEILKYLSPKPPKILSTYTTITEKDIEAIKDFLRTHYWLQSMEKMRGIKPKKRLDWKSPLSDFASALNCASHNRYGKHNLEIAALALACGTNINKITYMTTPLESAAENNVYDVTQFLLQQGVLNAFEISHYTSALSKAIKNDNVELTKLLINADMNGACHDCKPMHIAARSNALQVIRYLYDAGYDINGIDRPKDKRTPLHVAAYAHSSNAIKTLLTLGANPKLKDNQGRTYREIFD